MFAEVNDRSRDVVVVILGGGRGSRLFPLTEERAKPAVPIAGKYRLIDIPISNAIHSAMERILVLTQFNSVSLHRHIGQTYKFDSFSSGYVQILAAQQTPGNERWFQGTADAVRQNLRLIEGQRGDLVLILSGDHMYRMDYRMMLREHLDKDADITIGVLPCSEADIAAFGAARVAPDGRIVEFREKPGDAAARRGMEVDPDLLRAWGGSEGRPYLASMGIYLFRKEVLSEVLDTDDDDFGRDIIPRCVGSRRVQACFFDDYWRDIGTIRSFYDTHMDLLLPDPPFHVADPDWRILTRPRYLPPSRIRNCRIDGAMIPEGTELTDCTIDHAVVGIGTRATGVTIRRSYLMGADTKLWTDREGRIPVGIGPGTVIEGAIVDRNARIGRDVVLVNRSGVAEADGDGWAIRDGIVVVERNAVIPDGTEL